MKVDGENAFTRTQGLFSFIAWSGGIAIKQHATVDDAQLAAGAMDPDVDAKKADLAADGFILSPLAVS